MNSDDLIHFHDSINISMIKFPNLYLQLQYTSEHQKHKSNYRPDLDVFLLFNLHLFQTEFIISSLQSALPQRSLF